MLDISLTVVAPSDEQFSYWDLRIFKLKVSRIVDSLMSVILLSEEGRLSEALRLESRVQFSILRLRMWLENRGVRQLTYGDEDELVLYRIVQFEFGVEN